MIQRDSRNDTVKIFKALGFESFDRLIIFKGRVQTLGVFF